MPQICKCSTKIKKYTKHNFTQRLRNTVYIYFYLNISLFLDIRKELFNWNREDVCVCVCMCVWWIACVRGFHHLLPVKIWHNPAVPQTTGRGYSIWMSNCVVNSLPPPLCVCVCVSLQWSIMYGVCAAWWGAYKGVCVSVRQVCLAKYTWGNSALCSLALS